MKILLYINYGSNPVYDLELTYSVLSAAAFLRAEPSDIRIVVVAASERNVRSDLPAETILLTAAMAQEWQMDGTYNHAFQVFALHHVVNTYSAPTILIDSDTIFLKHPRYLFERVGPGRTITHVVEGTLADSSEREQWLELVDSISGNLLGYPVSMSTIMYNAGIQGIDPTDVALLEKVKAAMIAIRRESSIFTAIQLAVSVVFENETQLSTCEDVVEHYWGGPRAYYRYQINKMYPEILAAGHRSGNYGPLLPLRQLPPRLLGDRVAAWLKRTLRRKSKEFGHVFVSYRSALSVGNTDPELANVWATIALDTLIYGKGKVRLDAARDLPAFAPEALDALTWMSSGLRGRWNAYWIAKSQSIAKGAF